MIWLNDDDDDDDDDDNDDDEQPIYIAHNKLFSRARKRLLFRYSSINFLYMNH